MKFCLDTSIVVGSFRNRKEIKNLFLDVASKGDVFISIITYAELRYGAFRVQDRTLEERKISDFLTEFNVTIEPLTDSVARIYAEGRFFLEKKGGRIDDFDLLIGATAVASGAVLVTDNIKHFSRFPKLEIYSERR